MIEKRAEQKGGKLAVAAVLYGLLFVCVFQTGKDGILHFEAESVYRSGYEVEDNMQYLKEHITEEDYVYVGKTTARRISGVYSRHRTGAVKATACYFDQEESEGPPSARRFVTLRACANNVMRKLEV